MSQFAKFCIAGGLAFVVDAGVLMALADGLGMNPYLGRVLSFLAAATTTWWINRRFTFRVAASPTRAEWVRYVGLMVLGAAVNYGAYAASIAWWDVARANLWLGVAIGSVAGLGINFMTSRALFTRARSAPPPAP